MKKIINARVKELQRTLYWLQEKSIEVAFIQTDYINSKNDFCDLRINADTDILDIEVVFETDSDYPGEYDQTKDQTFISINMEDIYKTTEQLVQERQDIIDKKENDRLALIKAKKDAEIKRKEKLKNANLLKKEIQDKKEYKRLHKLYGKET